MKRGRSKSGVWYRSGDLIEYLPGVERECSEPRGPDLAIVDGFFRRDGELFAIFVQHPGEPFGRWERVENIRKVAP